mmetsp:Transcript_61460/g.125372  ORF Transcript_61460/g.125372 Transcript_61460/m.125372 type:complete len:87 (+) Transcript_61460:734-994(+)
MFQVSCIGMSIQISSSKTTELVRMLNFSIGSIRAGSQLQEHEQHRQQQQSLKGLQHPSSPATSVGLCTVCVVENFGLGGPPTCMAV